ncbi:coiled-coil domain-containing protein 191 isoform X1 [Canis lupus familiaris]|uniref:Coiled-coil domain containing 191 n=3 Tax=Canis lupus TaxID=9612 RepID=A0A8I3Q6Z1_CANLF|nr:coiled-coil domain-containing protein 191 isoform X1 [Canis lupus familiaris]XP_025332947.3 coiled-coil domain-containing protein 191 isoform X1 [Canis lupus dingo]XP_038300910.1 coiled-coil domain-containing protein 191 isoform X1 [Canis lupus familiaris]XP_038438787.1 coiled-coil domain-containing protein 191 isoform X1 [Canis lupus familiaris]|eukprot:XP_005639563.1 coiled-coil domain-containing protein 191 isoform X1 [Canis lupus familiaris]
MLPAPQEGCSSRKRTGPNRWKRMTRKPSPKPAFDPDNVEHWIKRVEKASEFAVSKAFSARNSHLPRRLWNQIVDLETSEQIEDHDEVYAEAQELVNDWLDTKLKQELVSDGEGDAEDTVSNIPPVLEASGHLKYDKFDELCGYLEEEEESTTVQKFIDHLLHQEVVDSGMLEDLGMNGNQDKQQQKDPRLTMEMRHKQVKENRMRREKELERQRMEKIQKKSVFLEAQYLVQEEKKKKALEAKKEEEEIQREMVKLRRELIERRLAVEEAWKIEQKKQEENSPKNTEKGLCQSDSVLLYEEKMAKERKKKLRALLIQTFKENRQCQKRYFSAWHSLILDRRITLGKAGTLSDWKFQLKVLRAWRDYTRSQKLARETQALENDLREANRKQQLATEYNRKQVLRQHFTEWQHWHRTEILKRELALTKEETRKKMNELLEAASLGKLSTNGSSGIVLLEEAATMVNPLRGNGGVPAGPPSGSRDCDPSPHPGTATKSHLQVPLQHVPPNTRDDKRPETPGVEPPQQPGAYKQLRTTSRKAESIRRGHLHNRHVFQQQLIEKQKQQLQEQQKTILELKESQRLAEARWAAERAAAATEAQSCPLTNPRGKGPPRTRQVLPNSPVASPGTNHRGNDSQNSLSGPRRIPRQLMAPHPILKAMEERAVQRAERRRILAEKKKKQEEEKLAQLKAQEEERQKREAEEKEAQLKKKREEKRLQKMKELEKQKRIKRNQQLEAVAREHYERVLLRKKGLEPWKRLRTQSKQNIQVAEEHHSLALQRKCLLSWFQYSQEILTRKTARADQFYCQILLRRVIRSWLQYLTHLEEEAQELCAHFLQKKIFGAWFNVVREAKIDSQSKHKTAVEHSDRRILWITFETWKKFVKFMKEERKKEERRAQLRRKVAEILPDFQLLAPP